MFWFGLFVVVVFVVVGILFLGVVGWFIIVVGFVGLVGVFLNIFVFSVLIWVFVILWIVGWYGECMLIYNVIFYYLVDFRIEVFKVMV